MAKNVTQDGDEKGMKEEIILPEGVAASLAGSVLTLKGPKGETSRNIEGQNVSVSVEGNKVSVLSANSSKKEKKIIGSLRAHIANMVKGATEGHVYRLKVCFTHFPITVSVSGSQLLVKNFLGEKIPRKLTLQAGVSVKVEGSELIVNSANKDAAGQTAAAVEQITKRAGFDTRVFGDGIYITVKDGKDIGQAKK
ncbi:50S ribosomal protein L6 [Candidatus Woesearchaeota archaeon]|nr:50S ribosomal protein L6 [Candidatus Woesearchaeota archaeon]